MEIESRPTDSSAGVDCTEGFSRLDLLRRGGLLAVGVAGAGAVIGSPLADARVSSSPIKTPEAIYQAWEERLNAADMKGMLNLYEEHVAFVSPQGRLTHGRDSVKKEFEALFALRAQIDIYERSHVVAGNICLTSNHWRMVISPKGGRTEHLKGGGVEVLRRGPDGGWRYVIDDASRMAVPAG
jgi:uncharacterized protein (TIGR02246 family)